MRAFKCDRCGKLFEDYYGRKTSSFYNISMGTGYLDLCKDCNDELQKWIKMESEENDGN